MPTNKNCFDKNQNEFNKRNQLLQSIQQINNHIGKKNQVPYWKDRTLDKSLLRGSTPHLTS